MSSYCTPPQRSAEQLRDLAAIKDALHCPVREAILWTLGCHGRINVGEIAKRSGIDQKTISDHLGKLRDLGLIFSEKKGKFVWCELNAGAVHYQQQGNECSLTVSRGSGVKVTVTVEIVPSPV